MENKPGARFIVLVLIHSFYGREDLGLTDRLLTELPGIFNWSVAERTQAFRPAKLRARRSTAT
jgi:hypothetical protein